MKTVLTLSSVVRPSLIIIASSGLILPMTPVVEKLAEAPQTEEASSEVAPAEARTEL
jgi:hypothetical protein